VIVSALDFHFYATGKLELHEGIHNLGSSVVDVDETLVAVEFELFAALLVDKGRAVDCEDTLVGRQGNGTADDRSNRLHCLYDFLGRLIDETVVVRFKFDTDNGVHILVCFYFT